jgi:hypothetical protein
MPFVSHPKLPGKVYIPTAPAQNQKKHPCPDCFSCQRCGDDRCQVCRGEVSCDQTDNGAIHVINTDKRNTDVHQ